MFWKVSLGHSCVVLGIAMMIGCGQPVAPREEASVGADAPSVVDAESETDAVMQDTTPDESNVESGAEPPQDTFSTDAAPDLLVLEGGPSPTDAMAPDAERMDASVSDVVRDVVAMDVGNDSTAIDSGPRCIPGRALVDRPDDSTEYQLHLLYVVPSDGMDRRLDQDGTIVRTTSVWNSWLASQTAGTNIRLDQCEGSLDVSFVRLTVTDAVVRARGLFARDAVEQAVREAGFASDRKLYLAYYDGTSLDTSCGSAPGAPSRRNNVAVMFLQGMFSNPSVPPCSTNRFAAAGEAPRYLEFSAVHEVFHALGAVPSCAPHATRSHTNDDPTDLMYAGTAPWNPSVLDPGRDDYYGHARTDCYDTALSPFLSPTPRNAALVPGW